MRHESKYKKLKWEQETKSKNEQDTKNEKIDERKEKEKWKQECEFKIPIVNT